MFETESTLTDSERTARDWWNSWAEQFQEEYGDGDIPVEIDFGPGAAAGDDLGLLGDLDGKAVVELGCGGGQFGIALSKRGADVTGIDLSTEQLEYARRLADEHGEDVELVEGTVTDMPMFGDGRFDLAVSAFAFQWVDDLSACFEEAHRILAGGGRLVFSVDHPFYKIVDPETREFRASYFDDSPRRLHSEQFGAEMVIHRRRIGETVQLLTEAGFTVETIREPGSADPDEYESEFGSFDPAVMSTVPPTVVYAARKE